MSIEFRHPYGTIYSDTSVTMKILGNVVFNSSSVVFPNSAVSKITSPVLGMMVYDTIDNKIKYYDGTQWLIWNSSSALSDDFQYKIDELYKLLNTKVDSVVYDIGSKAEAHITGTTLYITFPTFGSTTSQQLNGTRTNNPTSSVAYYAISSGMSLDNVREQLGGYYKSQDGRNGTTNLPYKTTSGWCVADGKTWVLNDEGGERKQVVPNLNQEQYLKSISSNESVNINNIILSKGSVTPTTLSVANLPRFTVNVDSSTNKWNLSNLGIVTIEGTNNSDLSNTTKMNINVSSTNGHTHDFSITSTPIGNGQSHNHTIVANDSDNLKAVVLYYMGLPSTQITDDSASTDFVKKAGDKMTGTLVVPNEISIQATGTISQLMINNGNTENGSIYVDTKMNRMNLRSNTGTAVVLNSDRSMQIRDIVTSTINSKINNKIMITQVNGLSSGSSIVLNSVPVGVPMPSPSGVVPDGWLKCNGQVFDKNRYPELSKLFPSGRLPDLRGEFICGLDEGRGLDPNRTILSHQDHAIGKHKHVMATNNDLHVGLPGSKLVWRGRNYQRDYKQYVWQTNDGTDFLTSKVNDLSIFGDENRPKNVAFLYIIKAG